MNERSRSFECFGGRVAVHLAPHGAHPAEAEAELVLAAARLLRIHARLTRFSADSELSRLNADPRLEVPASPLLRDLAAAVRRAGELSGGLVDATCLDALEAGGYRRPLDPAAGTRQRHLHPRPRPAIPDLAGHWRLVSVDDERGSVLRPPGLRIDSGGLGKGLAADLVAEGLADRDTYAVDCAGDLRAGGAAGRERRIFVRDPWGGDPVDEVVLVDGAVATSGITARSWRGPNGRLAHHLIDPGRGVPAWTGVVQATALAPTALEAEVLAKAALLAGPDAGRSYLSHGGVLVLDGGDLARVTPPRVEATAA